MDDLEAVIGADTLTMEADGLPLSVPASDEQGLSTSDVVEAAISLDPAPSNTPSGMKETTTKGRTATSSENPIAKDTSDDLAVRSDWPPRVGEHIAGNFTDGFHIGEVEEILDENTVRVSYMVPKEILTAADDEHSRRFWCWPRKKHMHDTDRSCILNLKPCLVLATPPSTKRLYVFACENAEILEIIANSVSEEL